MCFRSHFAQKVRTGVTSFPGTGYLNWFGSLSTFSLGLRSCAPRCYSNLRYSNPAQPSRPVGRDTGRRWCGTGGEWEAQGGTGVERGGRLAPREPTSRNRGHYVLRAGTNKNRSEEPAMARCGGRVGRLDSGTKYHLFLKENCRGDPHIIKTVI